MLEPMRYAVVFGILGILLAQGAIQAASTDSGAILRAIACAEAYLALSLFTLAFAYLFDHLSVPVEGLFQHPVWMRVIDLLLLPYRLLARLTVSLAHRFDSMEMMHPVGPRLFVGRIPFPHDRYRLQEAGVTSVLNLCAEFPKRSRLRDDQVMETVYLPILDGTAPSRAQFERAMEWIASRHVAGHTVLVHCAQGRGRSVTVAAAALCRLGLASSPEEALATIKAARPKAKPSRKQRAALSRFLARSA